MPISTPASWHTGPLFPSLPPVESLDIYGVRGASLEARLTITALAGLVNRGPAKIYLAKNGVDDFWLKELDPALPCQNVAVAASEVLAHLLSTYHDVVKGLIIYDPMLPATMNIATTLAGLRNGLLVSPTQANDLQEEPYQLPVLADLRVHRWKNALQAYVWAYQHLLPECSDTLVAGLDPNVPDCLRSFLVTHRVFTYWLDARNIWPHPSQDLLSERGLLKRILARFPPGSLHLGWFVNEPLGVRLTSQAALLTFASDFCTNLEVWSSLPLTFVKNKLAYPVATEIEEAISALEKRSLESITQEVESLLEDSSEDVRGMLEDTASALIEIVESDPSDEQMAGPPPTSEADKPTQTFLSFTFSDGDNLQYCQNRLLQMWSDQARGKVPIGWTISPALQEIMPAQAAYYRQTASENDELIASPSGIAYMLPSYFPRTHREAFLRSTAKHMQNMDLDLMQVLDSGTLFSMKIIHFSLQDLFITQLAPSGLRGIFSGWGNDYPSWSRHADVLVYQNLGNLGLPLDVQKTSDLIQEAAARGNRFINIYLFAWNTTPSDLQAIVKQLGDTFHIVKPGRLLELIEEQGE